MRTFNPLTTDFFRPRQHIFMHSAHTSFVGTHSPAHSIQTWWVSHTWRAPSGHTVWPHAHTYHDIRDHPQALLIIFMTTHKRRLNVEFSPGPLNDIHVNDIHDHPQAQNRRLNVDFQPNSPPGPLNLTAGTSYTTNLIEDPLASFPGAR